MGLSTPGQAEITSLDSGNIDDVLSKASLRPFNFSLCTSFLTCLDTFIFLTVCYFPQALGKSQA